MKGFPLAFVTAIGLAASVPALALPVDAFYVSGTNYTIPDDDPNGIQSTIYVPDDRKIEKISIIVTLDHTWVGDLIFTLTGPDGQTITLLDRPGTTDPDTDAGDSSNASADYSLTFGDAGPEPAEMMGAGCADTDSIIGLDCGKRFTPETSPSEAWAGLSALGDWTLTISDNAELDLGELDGWIIAFRYEAVPLPAGVWLLASGIIALAARRRRQ
jgi:subtilisin-like proprotein convertase family protein